MKVLTDDEVFGGTGLSDEEVFGTPAAVQTAAPARPLNVSPEPSPMSGSVPLPRERPLRADVAETQPMPPVMPLEDVPFRAAMRGKVTDEETGETREAPGLTGMYTGTEAYDTWKSSVVAAEDVVDAAKERVIAAKNRQEQAAGGDMGRRGTTGALRWTALQSDVDAAEKELSNAEKALATTSAATPARETPQRVFGSAMATAVGNVVPTIVRGCRETH